MSADLSAVPDQSSQPHYARFSRRFRGTFIDSVVVLIVIFGAMFVAVTIGHDWLSRSLGILVAITLLLYEPVLVSHFGGTIGHYLTNLRVVDDRTGGNVSFLKAVARMVIKGLLGWYSFIVMAATRRNQAVHDLLTQSTVQIRDLTKATASQYITERTDAQATSLPARSRRIAVICTYLVLMLVVYYGILAGLTGIGAITTRCVDSDICAPGERMVVFAGPFALFGVVAGCIVLGWTGRLLGARKTF